MLRKAGRAACVSANWQGEQVGHTSQAHQPPNAAGMLAVYAPVQAPAPEGQVLPWVYGETDLKAGDRRTYNGIVYEAIQAPNIDAVAIASRLGHSDASTTLRTYAHALRRRDVDSANAMQALMERADT